MALYLENFDLDFFREDEDMLMGLMGHVAKEGKGITGYYGLPYLNLHYGDVQMILRTDHREDGEGLEVQGLDTHAKGNAVWECRLNSIDINKNERDKLSRRVMVTRLDGSGGMAVVTLVNADVLPSFLEDDTIKMQMIGFPELIQYFEDEDAYAESQPSLRGGQKFMLSEGSVFPSGFMRNRSPEDPDFESDEHLDDITNIRGTVKRCYYGKFTLGEESHDTFVFCDIDTEYGPLQLVHTIGQVEEGQRKNMKPGSVVNFYGLLSGDVAIYEYEKGVARDAAHDLAALRYMFSGNDPERIRSILSDDCVYLVEYNGSTYTGPDAIIERLKTVQSDHSEKYYAHMATITEIDPGDKELAYPIGTRCLVLASGEETKYESIAFIDVNDDGNICRIITSVEPRYRFSVDEKPHKKNIFEDVKLPESVAEPILMRARFHAVIDESITDEAVINDTEENKSYEDNVHQMLETMPSGDEAGREKLLANLFGYLFAKAAEMEYSQEHPTGFRGIFHSRLTASYTPNDAWNGVIQSTLSKDRHEKLEGIMDLGRQFYKDFKFFQENCANEEYADNLMRALVLVQRLGRFYSRKGLGW